MARKLRNFGKPRIIGHRAESASTIAHRTFKLYKKKMSRKDAKKKAKQDKEWIEAWSV